MYIYGYLCGMRDRTDVVIDKSYIEIDFKTVKFSGYFTKYRKTTLEWYGCYYNKRALGSLSSVLRRRKNKKSSNNKINSPIN